MRAMTWNHAGASPLARISLLELKLDPEWHQLFHFVKMFRHQYRSNQIVLDWWKLYYTADSGENTHGPFGKLSALLHELGLQINEDCRLWFSSNGFINALHCSETVLEWVPDSFAMPKLRSCPSARVFRAWRMVAMWALRSAMTTVSTLRSLES